MTGEQIQYIPIVKITEETPFVKTFYFPQMLPSRPGQFVMLWLPGIDQKPFSVGSADGEKFGLTIFKRGPLTSALFEKHVGDRAGLSGPYGTAFSVRPNTHYIMVGGGYGAAPLAYLAEQAVAINATVDFCIGARSQEHLLFEKRLRQLPGVTLHITTDDGSSGQKGLVTDVFKKLTEKAANNTLVATCGPELMEKSVLDICNEKNIDCEISIERYMKCGTGVCGQCCVDPLGIAMCQQGPVVSKNLANKITEFGVYHRDKSGKKKYFE